MSKSKLKAGVIPYYYGSNGTLWMMFQTSSDPKFGGPDPMISKGDVEADEDVEEAAMREAAEELGLIEENVIEKTLLWESKMYGYKLVLYAAHIADTARFNEPHWETAKTDWMTLQDFQERGRQDHKFIVEYFHKKLSL